MMNRPQRASAVPHMPLPAHISNIRANIFVRDANAFILALLITCRHAMDYLANASNCSRTMSLNTYIMHIYFVVRCVGDKKGKHVQGLFFQTLTVMSI